MDRIVSKRIDARILICIGLAFAFIAIALISQDGLFFVLSGTASGIGLGLIWCARIIMNRELESLG